MPLLRPLDGAGTDYHVPRLLASRLDPNGGPIRVARTLPHVSRAQPILRPQMSVEPAILRVKSGHHLGDIPAAALATSWQLR